jgi:4-hydroxybenzoyl-CoA thioesterase
MVFSIKKNIRFSHCDPAGIVFYPRYVELCNEVVEDWFRQALGVDFHELHEQRRLGVPAVRLNVEYLAPSTYGDVLDFSLQVLELGASSMSLLVLASCRNRERVRIELKVVMISMDSMRPVMIDDQWRQAFSDFLA